MLSEATYSPENIVIAVDLSFDLRQSGNIFTKMPTAFENTLKYGGNTRFPTERKDPEPKALLSLNFGTCQIYSEFRAVNDLFALGLNVVCL